MANTEEYEQLLYRFFYELEKEFHDGVDRGNHRRRQERYALWSQMGVRKLVRSLEDWFKGELSLFLNSMQEKGQIMAWDCEYWSQGGRSDFLIDFGPSFPRLVLEVKCLVKGRQGGAKSKTGEPSSVGYTMNVYSVVDDLRKAREEGEQLYCLLFMYPSATETEIEGIIDSLHRRMIKKGVQATVSWKGPYYFPLQESLLSIGKIEVSLRAGGSAA